MTDKDMHDWEEILSGRAVPDADPETAREARLLREVLLEERAREAPVLDAGAHTRFLTRLDQEGVLPHKKPVPRGVWSSLAAAAVLMLILNPLFLIHTWMGEDPSGSWQTHSVPPLLVITTASPDEQAKTVRQLLQQLRELAPRSHTVGANQISLEVHIPSPAPRAFTDVLQEYNLPRPRLPEEESIWRPWARRLLQWAGLMDRPVHRVLIEVIPTAGG